MHDRRHESGHGSAVEGHAGHASAAIGKSSLTQGLAPVDPTGPAAPPDPQALIAEVQQAAIAGQAHKALKLMASVPRPQQIEIATAISPEARHSFAKNMPTNIGNHHPTRVTTNVLFQHTPDAERATLELMFEARFRVQIGTHPIAKHGRKFDPLGLRQMWEVFEDLPPEHVAKNWAVAKLDRYHDTKDDDPKHAHGLFAGPEGRAGEIDLSYTDSIITDGGTTDHDRQGDPLHGVNRFDEVARHEVGHAVDRELGWPSFGTLSQTEEAGQWEGYYTPEDYRRAAEQMVTGSAGPIQALPAAERTQVIDAMVASMSHSDTTHFRNAIDKLDGHPGLKSDAVYRVMTKGLASQSPWLDTHAIAGRHYHQAYTGPDKRGAGAQWTSYSEKAYSQHRVSEYQFRAIQEWFAEAYAAFYTPGEAGEPKGSRLKQKLPETHAWFKKHVDNKTAVKNESKAARKDDHAPKKPTRP
ncbi:MAG TPA: hypothetical protein VK601_04685 [Kofleriaceae bacterium]|nr:hypothetical protein [Kofleriaceae bacterium]